MPGPEWVSSTSYLYVHLALCAGSIFWGAASVHFLLYPEKRYKITPISFTVKYLQYMLSKIIKNEYIRMLILGIAPHTMGLTMQA